MASESSSVTKLNALPVSKVTGKPLPRNADFTYPEGIGELLKAAFATTERLVDEYRGLTWSDLSAYNPDVFLALKDRQFRTLRQKNLPDRFRVLAGNPVTMEGLDALKTTALRNGAESSASLPEMINQASLLAKPYGEIKNADEAIAKQICRKYYKNRSRFPDGHSLRLTTVIDNAFLDLLEKPVKPAPFPAKELRASGTKSRLRRIAMQRFAEAETFAQYRRDHPQATQLRYVQAVLARSNLRADEDKVPLTSAEIQVPLHHYVPYGAITIHDFNLLNAGDPNWVPLKSTTRQSAGLHGTTTHTSPHRGHIAPTLGQTIHPRPNRVEITLVNC